MRRGFVVTAMLIAGVPAFRAVADACGDKFMKVGHGVRYNRMYAAVYRATILVYTPSAPAAAILDSKFQASLSRAGHDVQVAREKEQLATALQSGRVDLVLAGVADVEAITSAAEQSPSRPVVLPVMYKPTKAEAQAVKARYHLELKASDNPARYLAALDETMKARVKQRRTGKS